MANIQQPNIQGILLGYCMYFIVFFKEHYRCCSVLYEHISIDVYVVIAGIAIFIFLWSLMFFFWMALVTILIHDIIYIEGHNVFDGWLRFL